MVSQSVEPVRDSSPETAGPHDPKAMRIFARTLYEDMVSEGLSRDQILAVATHLIGELTESMRDRTDPIGGNA